MPELGNLLGLSSQLLEERALKVPAAKALIRKQVGLQGRHWAGVTVWRDMVEISEELSQSAVCRPARLLPGRCTLKL